MATLKSIAAAHGLKLGVGPVDPSVPAGAPTWIWVPVPPGFVWSFPTALDAGANAAANIIVNDFGGSVDLCCWARGPMDLTHYGKFERWLGAGVYDFAGPDDTYAWALANGMRVWISDPAYSGVPDWIATWNGSAYVKNPAYTAADLTNLLQAWYTAVYSRYPQAYGTTSLNELRGGTSRWNIGFYYQNASIGAPGGNTVEQFAATITQWIRAANANIKIIANDYGHEWSDSAMTAMIAFAQGVVAAGGYVDGIGFQSHMSDPGTLYGPVWDVYRSNLQRAAAAGFEPVITEFDVNASRGADVAAEHYYYGVRAAIDSGVVETLNFWSIKDPLFYGAAIPPGTGAPYDDQLVATVTRAKIEQALTLGTAVEVAGAPLDLPLCMSAGDVAALQTSRLVLPGPLKIWNGTAFVDAPLKLFDGSNLS